MHEGTINIKTLESRVNRELCRNGKFTKKVNKSDTAKEDSRAGATAISHPRRCLSCSLNKAGFLMSPTGILTRESLAERSPEHITGYISADSIPEIAAARRAERESAQRIIESRQILTDVEGNEELRPIDALSSARRVIDAQNEFGDGSKEHQQARRGLFRDCLRLLGEWRRKNTDAYFPPIEHEHDPETGGYLADGYSTLDMTKAALIPSTEREEDDRRVNERVEDITSAVVKQVGSTVLGSTVKMRIVSECTDWAIRAHRIDGKSRGGYVPEIEKLMIRDMLIDIKKGNRFQEQLGLPGTYINHYVLQRALKKREFDASALNKTELHGTQLFVHDDIFEFVALLDEIASEEWCVNIFMGEVVPDDFVKDYNRVREEAIVREESLTRDANMVSDFVLDLAKNNADPETAPTEVEEFVKQLLITIAREDTNITTDMFDQQTYDGLMRVQLLQARGQEELARNLLIDVIEAAPGGGYCGAGSCDLVRAKLIGEEADSLKKLGFDPKNTLMDKGDRKCKSCHKNSVAYDLKKKQKGCVNVNCGAKAKF